MASVVDCEEDAAKAAKAVKAKHPRGTTVTARGKGSAGSTARGKGSAGSCKSSSSTSAAKAEKPS